MQVAFALWALTIVFDIDRRRNDRAAQRAAQDFLKSRHLHGPRRFTGFGAPRATLRFFARFFAFPFATLTVVILVTALAVFSFHRKGFREKSPVFASIYG